MKKVLSFVLVLTLCVILVPAALASGELEETVSGEEALMPVAEEVSSEPEEEPAENGAAQEEISDAQPEETMVSVTVEVADAVLGEPALDGAVSERFGEAELAAAEKSIRSHLVAHDTEFTIQMTMQKDEGSLSDELISSIMVPVANSLFQKAMEHDGTPNGGDYVLWGVSGLGYSYGASYYASAKTADITLSFSVNYYTTAAQENAITTKIKSVLSNLSLTGKTDYEKVKAIHDWICTNVSYDQATNVPDLSFTAYNALFAGKAVCQGYSVLFYRMCLASGVDCRVVAGYCDPNGSGIKSELHSWNIVKLGERYYYVDCTWDAPRMEHEPTFFLCRGYDTFTDIAKGSSHGFSNFSTFGGFNTTDYNVSSYNSTTKSWTNAGTTYLISVPDWVLGDFNYNGAVDALDLVQLAKYLSGETTAIADVGKAYLTGGTEVSLLDLVKAIKTAAVK